MHRVESQQQDFLNEDDESEMRIARVLIGGVRNTQTVPVCLVSGEKSAVIQFIPDTGIK